MFIVILTAIILGQVVVEPHLVFPAVYDNESHSVSETKRLCFIPSLVKRFEEVALATTCTLSDRINC